MNRNQDQLAKKLVPIFLGMTPDTPEKIPQVLFEELNIENDNGRVDRGDKIEDIKCIVKNDSDYDWDTKT